jgi:hypothetical protein
MVFSKQLGFYQANCGFQQQTRGFTNQSLDFSKTQGYQNGDRL